MKLKVAVIQFNAGRDKSKNIVRALKMVEEAARKRAKFILLPEIFSYRGPLKDVKTRMAVAEGMNGPLVKSFSVLARKYKTHILAGSFHEKAPRQSKVYNTSALIGPGGKREAAYRKNNLFDARIGKTAIRESAQFLAGRSGVLAKVGGFKVGLSVCYDLRFPELYRRYAKKGVEVLCVPSAFTHTTGKAHWQVLLRARAIENLSYVLAPNQVGKDHRGVKSFGHSLIINPWGEILAEGSSAREEILYAQLDKQHINNFRAVLPALRKGVSHG